MTEPLDPLLRALGDVERDLERRHPTDWEDALAGRRDPAEVAAARAGLDPADEHAVFSDMFSRPASEAELEALIGRAAEVLAAPVGGEAGGAPGMSSGSGPRTGRLADPSVSDNMSSGTATEVGPGSARAGAPDAASQPAPSSGQGAPAPAPVIPLAARRRALALAGGVLAVAAAFLLWRFTTTGPAAALTGYTVTVRNSAVHELRGDEPTGEVARYRPDSEIDWIVSPERAAPDEVDLRVLARAPDGRAELLAPPFTRSAAGALRLRGRLDAALPLAPGRWTLTLVVSPAGQAPRSADEAADALTHGRAVAAAPPLELELVPAD